MAISTIRKLTATDAERLEATAVRFAKRHSIQFHDDEPALDAVEWAMDSALGGRDANPALVRLWRRAYARALRQPESAGERWLWLHRALRPRLVHSNPSPDVPSTQP